jgi:hypothetical protein
MVFLFTFRSWSDPIVILTLENTAKKSHHPNQSPVAAARDIGR